MTAAIRATPVPGLPVRLLCVLFIFFDFPAFTIQLATDGGRFVGSPVFQIITVGCELFVIATFLSSRPARTLLASCWPAWTLVGACFLSSLWSFNPGATVHAANTYMIISFFGLALVGLFPGFDCIRLMIRTMVLGCVLSLLWVFLFPEAGVHQLTDPVQVVHAGLWRGIFSHKQGLGLFAGMTAGLLIFYRTAIFPTVVLVASLACAVTCLAGSESATGFITMVITPALFYVARFITKLPLPLRKPFFVKFAIAAAVTGLGFKLGVFDFVIVQILGKSTDMTGRTDIWPFVLQNFANSGYAFTGSGFASNLAADLSEWSVDNGFIDKYLEFGYLLSPLVFGIFALTLWWGIQLITTTRNKDTNADVFPFAMWSVILIVNISESNFMLKCLSTLLTSIVLGMLFSANRQVQQ
jgi:O-antigen ligase